MIIGISLLNLYQATTSDLLKVGLVGSTQAGTPGKSLYSLMVRPMATAA